MDQNVIQVVKLHFKKWIVALEELKKVYLKDVKIVLGKAWYEMKCKMWSQNLSHSLLTQVDDSWDENDYLPFQWRDKIELEGIEKQIHKFTALKNHISEGNKE